MKWQFFFLLIGLTNIKEVVKCKKMNEVSVNNAPLTSWDGIVECAEDRSHKHTDEEIDQGGEGPVGCCGTQDRMNDDYDSHFYFFFLNN